jgi:membrane-associated phospholipid phosphatase
MPPVYQDPLAVVARAQWRWLDVARALLEVSCEPWALALVALALYSFFERDVKGVFKALVPLALALAATAALALVARVLGGVPRPLDGARHARGPVLARVFPSGQAAAVAAFVAYTALAYGRRAAPAVAVAAAAGVVRALGAAQWATDLLAGSLAGTALGAGAYLGAIRLLPDGHLERLRRRRRDAHAPEPPSGPR